MYYRPSLAINLLFTFVLLMPGMVSFSQGWEWKNPLPQGNNIFSTWVTDENTAFLVGDYGTIMRTKDGGNTWDYYNCNTTAHFNAVTFADDMTGYVGGHYGKLYKTTNGGDSWFRLECSISQDVFTSISFISPDTGFVLSVYGKLYKTTDGGSSWTTANIGGDCVRFFDSQNGIITNSHAVFRTNDGGVTWEMSELGPPVTDCAYASANIVLIAGYYMRRSIDGGITWNLVPDAPTHMFSIYFVDELTGYVGGSEGRIYKTTDAGLTWQLQSQNGQETILSIHLVGETGFAAGVGPFRTALHKTSNGGNNWQNLTSGIGITAFMDLAIADENTIFCVGTHRILKSDDQGNNWQIVDSTPGFHNAVDFPTVHIGYVGGSGTSPSASMLKTIDGGVTWQTLSAPATLNISSIDFVSETHGIAVGDGSIFRTTDGGNTWTSQYYNYVTMFEDVKFVDSLHGYAVGGNWFDEVPYGNIMKTNDGGITWINTIVPNYLKSVSFPFQNIGYVAGANTIMKTVNGGYDWTEVEGSNINGANSLYFINADTGFAVNNGHVRKTTDGGLNWTNQWSKTGNTIQVIKFINENTGFIAGSGCILLKTTDGGGFPVVVKDVPLISTKLNVFPNPVNDEITVETIPNSTLMVYNLTGRLLLCQKTYGVFTKLNFSEYANGMYIIRQYGESNIAISKVIKN